MLSPKSSVALRSWVFFVCCCCCFAGRKRSSALTLFSSIFWWPADISSLLLWAYRKQEGKAIKLKGMKSFSFLYKALSLTRKAYCQQKHFLYSRSSLQTSNNLIPIFHTKILLNLRWSKSINFSLRHRSYTLWNHISAVARSLFIEVLYMDVSWPNLKFCFIETIAVSDFLDQYTLTGLSWGKLKTCYCEAKRETFPKMRDIFLLIPAVWSKTMFSF